jgi:predicted  nucleic acid-binding Zn-ribbon protein
VHCRGRVIVVAVLASAHLSQSPFDGELSIPELLANEGKQVASTSLMKRVERLEDHWQVLSALPQAMASVTLRLTDMEGRLTDVEGRLTNVEGRLTNVEAEIVQLRTEMRDEFSALRQEMRAGDEETRYFMRILHEEVLARIAAIGER